MRAKQAVIYVRVSTDKQADQGVSLDNQERACYDWSFRNNVQPIKLFREEGVSAKTLNRPELQLMIEFIQANADDIDYLVVYQIDRISRNLPDFIDLVRMINKLGVELRDSSSQLESNESDELIQSIQAALAQHENKLKSKRVKENMTRHSQDGFRMHKAPYGLKNIRDEHNRPTVAPMSPVADDIAYLLIEFSKGGYNKTQLLSEARRIGLLMPNGNIMSSQTLDRILANPLYAGMERNSFTNGELVDSEFEGIIPKWVYKTNQQILSGRTSRNSHGYQRYHPDYPLRGFVTCEDCGKPLRGSAPTGKSGKRYPRYHCTSPDCHSINVKPSDLHEQFLSLLEDITPDEGRLRLMKEVILRVWRDEIKAIRGRRIKVNQKLDRLREQKLDIIEKATFGDLSKENEVALLERVNSRIGTLKYELDSTEQVIDKKEDVVEYIANHMSNVRILWESAQPENQAIYQKMIFPEGLTYNLHSKAFGTPVLSPLYRLANIKKDLAHSEKSLMVIPRRIELRLPD